MGYALNFYTTFPTKIDLAKDSTKTIYNFSQIEEYILGLIHISVFDPPKLSEKAEKFDLPYRNIE
ncbi:hypothetical protein THRCLA_20474 [Thraustotheca clavata]|uniref:Uncharacterized protein n=1 Tax=Thraustotheca clavata TaxID=74557 RepID=A0A1W0A6R2_9STRA|nr:hypothetical protein THRCLA_20474 [Thraustotheca clavata]